MKVFDKEKWEAAMSCAYDACPEGTFTFGQPIQSCRDLSITTNSDGYFELAPREDLMAKALLEARADERAKVLDEVTRYRAWKASSSSIADAYDAPPIGRLLAFLRRGEP